MYKIVSTKKDHKQWKIKYAERKRFLARLWYRDNKEKVIKSINKRRCFRRYGITIKEREELVKKQKSRCLICKVKCKLVVDHDHTTKKVRGMLCALCNRNLGTYEKWGSRFGAYLMEHRNGTNN